MTTTRFAMQRLFVLLMVATLTTSCGKDGVTPITDPPDEETPLQGVRTVPVQVILPNDVDLDLTTTQVSSVFEDHAVSGAGVSTATYRDGTERSLVSLQDADGRLLLLGFITDDKREISITSTAKVAFYLGLGTIFLPDAIKAQFVEEASTLPGFDDFVAEAEALFADDRYFLTGDAFRELVQTHVDDLTAPGDIADPARVSLGLPGDIRSGIQLEEQPGDEVVLVNTYRRRAHAFFYRTRTEDLDGNPTVHIPDIVGSNASAQHAVDVPTPFAATSWIGTVQNYASGKGIEVARKESAPTVLALGRRREREALYMVRVIGPSERPAALTDQEETQLRELYMETLAFDVALPLLMAFMGEDSFLEDFQKSQWGGFFNQFKVVVGSISSIDDALTQGDLDKATRDFLDAFEDAAVASLMEGLYNALIQNFGTLTGGYTAAQTAAALEGSERMFTFMRGLDMILQVNDFLRLYAGYANSNTLEEFDVLVTRDKVRLDPRETLVIQGEEKLFTATVQDSDLAAGESYEYRWSITESYGELRSQSSTATGTSIVSSSNRVGYFSSNATSIPEDATDTISVEVFINHGTAAPLTRVGEAKAAIEIRPLGFMIEPDDVTIEGGSSVRLYARRTDGTNPVTDASLDYRFVWYTPGSYGLFNGTQSDIAVVNDNTMVYEALDRETREGTEEVEVSIYARRKDTSDRYRFVDRVSAEIQIDNDPLRKSYFVDFVTVGEPPHIEDNGIYCSWNAPARRSFSSPHVPADGLEVVDHTVTITDADPPWPAIMGTGNTWLPENAISEVEDSLAVYSSLEMYPDSVHTEVEEDVYVYRFGGTGTQGGSLSTAPPPRARTSRAPWRSTKRSQGEPRSWSPSSTKRSEPAWTQAQRNTRSATGERHHGPEAQHPELG